MSEPVPIYRSPLLMSAVDSALLIMDVQEKLLPHVRGSRTIVWNIRRLLDAAGLLEVPVVATVQYPQGLGATVGELADRIPACAEKLTFSCRACPELFAPLREQGRDKILVTGIEAHVCVQQSVLDLLAAGFSPYVAVDAVGSRSEQDYRVALRRMESSGATLTTTEATLFELCDQAGTDTFRQISQLVRETPDGK